MEALGPAQDPEHKGGAAPTTFSLTLDLILTLILTLILSPETQTLTLTLILPPCVQHAVWDVLSPTEWERVLWDIIMALALLYAIIITPYIVAFNIRTVSGRCAPCVGGGRKVTGTHAVYRVRRGIARPNELPASMHAQLLPCWSHRAWPAVATTPHAWPLYTFGGSTWERVV